MKAGIKRQKAGRELDKYIYIYIMGVNFTIILAKKGVQKWEKSKKGF